MWLIETLQCLFVSCSSPSNSESLASSVNINRSSGHNYSSIPVVCWHGVNDDAKSCDMIFRTLSEDVYTLSIQIGESLEVDKYNSVFMEMMEQVDQGCQTIVSDPQLVEGYHGVGISQGGLLLRGVAQLCPDPPMRSLVTIGSPHQGIFGLPKCSNSNEFDECTLVRNFLSKGAYIPWIQDLIAPAQYWHDPLQEQEFTDISKYLAIINNQQDVMNETIKNNFLNLKNFVMILWKDDTFIIPKESSHFGYYMTNQTEIVEPFEETDLFREDWIGLKQMKTDGKVHLLSMDGDHMDFDSDWFHDNVVTKFLL